ncbi:MAG: glycosyltransferase, partial [Thermoleophilaceae bacterium]
RDILAGAETGDERCAIALAVYLHRLAGAVARMVCALGDLDALAFTGGVGEHAPAIRAATVERLAFLGLEIDLHGCALVPAGVPVVLQVSRWDGLKDHEGVMSAFADHRAPRTEAHLVLAGPSTAAVADDPEGLGVLEDLKRQWASLPARIRERVHLVSLPMEDIEENAAIVNALQRRASVVAQKSLAEGFGLTVSEAMWKGRPVVAGDVGGIRDQIVDGRSGALVEPSDLAGFADAVRSLLDEPERARIMGEAAREQIRGRFLGPRHLTQYVDLFDRLLADSSAP